MERIDEELPVRGAPGARSPGAPRGKVLRYALVIAVATNFPSTS